MIGPLNRCRSEGRLVLTRPNWPQVRPSNRSMAEDGSKAANANDHYWHSLRPSEGILRLWTLFPLHSLAIIKSGDAREHNANRYSSLYYTFVLCLPRFIVAVCATAQCLRRQVAKVTPKSEPTKQNDASVQHVF